MNALIPMRVLVIFTACIVLLVGCQSRSGSIPTSTGGAALSASESWLLSDLSNQSNTAIAADASAAIIETHLRRRGITLNTTLDVPARYQVTGHVSRWQYEGTVSARPAVALNVVVTDKHSNQLVWQKSLSSTGKRRESISGLADRLIARLVNDMPLTFKPVGNEPKLASTSPVLAASSLNSTLGKDRIEDANHFYKTQIQTQQSLEGRSIAFYYANNPPVDELAQYDRLVLEPDNINATELTRLTADGARAYAYLSVGEVGPHRGYRRDIDESWMLGVNSTWDSRVLDLANANLREFLLMQVDLLHEQGYQGLFLDTMDSFNIVAKTDNEKARQRAGLVSLIKEMGSRFPHLKLITNRGFEVLDEIAPQVEAVAAESLYASWNNNTNSYGSVPAGDREWLLGKLSHVKDNLGLDVIAIDYMPPSKRVSARDVAARIASLGFIPWVATPELDYVGIGALEVVPRKVLMVYDSAIDGAIENTRVHRFLAMPIEYMGYVPEYLDLSKQPLPTGILKGRYAGIAIWPEGAYSTQGLGEWLNKQVDDSLPLAMLGVPPVAFDLRMQKSLGVKVTGQLDIASAAVSHRDAFIKPDQTISPRITTVGLETRSLDPDNAVHLSYEDKNGSVADMVVTGEFGGFAWKPAVIEMGLDLEALWVVEPFKFLRKALQLPYVPMPDVTTENGKRLWLAHIDGDALPSWAEMPGKRLGAEVISDEILEPYALPHSISIVEAEMTELDDYADRRGHMFSVMRDVFKLDNVELASHTYSHPFNWSELAQYQVPGKYNLPIEGYRYSPERETQGSIEFIDRELAPANKRTAIMLWSGNALPGERDLAVLDKLGIPNMNGGQTLATKANPSMTGVGPMARPVGNYVQVYAPILNENVYTNNWRGPFDGFKRVVETFEITDSPRRLKPINIYYHFYSGTKIASVKALKHVYDWSVQQEIFPVYGSEYATKVPDYRQVGVARYLTGEWKVSRLGGVRSIRMLSENKWPSLSDSQGLVGARKLHDGVYVHTDGNDTVTFGTARRAPTGVHLVSSNAKVEYWEKKPEGLVFRVKGELPVVLELGGNAVSSCSVRTASGVVRGVVTKARTNIFTFTTKDTGNAILNCPA